MTLVRLTEKWKRNRPKTASERKLIRERLDLREFLIAEEQAKAGRPQKKTAARKAHVAAWEKAVAQAKKRKARR